MGFDQTVIYRCRKVGARRSRSNNITALSDFSVPDAVRLKCRLLCQERFWPRRSISGGEKAERKRCAGQCKGSGPFGPYSIGRTEIERRVHHDTYLEFSILEDESFSKAHSRSFGAVHASRGQNQQTIV